MSKIFTVLLIVALGLLIATNVRKQDAQADIAVSDAISPEMPQIAMDTLLAQAKLPVLKINGKENPDVYLQALDIQVEITGNIASTRYTMVFKNKTFSVLEGELTFPLSDERTVTYYALDINGKMRKAMPVEKAKAAQVFEEIEQRQVDPGLLERVEGNNFRTRIYPIPAKGTRIISIGYEEELAFEKGLLRYRLPTAYQDSLENFSIKATVWNGSQEPFVYESSEPSSGLALALPAPADIAQVMVQPAQGSYYFLAAIAPQMETRKKQWSDELAIVWDVSLSASQRNLQREVEMLDILFSENENAKIHLYFLNNKLKKIASGNWSKLKSILESAIFDGGTDFSQIKLNEIAGDEILFFSDGISTLSEANFLKNEKVKRPVHCIVSSEKADYSAMKLIAGKTKGKFVNINSLSLENLKNELQNETLQFLGTEHGNSVREVYPNIAMPVHGNFSIAGISDAKNAEIALLFGFGGKAEKKIKVKLDAKNASVHGNTYKIWAQKKIAELDLDYEKNRAELAELGKQFGIVTRNTSLIVLETIEDYVNYGIAPPAELRAEYQRMVKLRAESLRETQRDMLNDAVVAAERIKSWWNIDFAPKKPIYPEPDEENFSVSESAAMKEESVISRKPSERPRKLAGSGGKARGRGSPNAPQSRGVLKMLSASDWEDEISKPVIKIEPIKKDNDYLNKLTGKPADDYKTYLKLREDYANSPTFYFDMADWFYAHGDKETALRILTSIAELELENASLYRLLGYKLKEYGKYALEKFICQKVIQWRPMEPQSYRDYALALADNGEAQAALDSLYSLLTKPYSANIGRRSRGIEEVAVMEINRLIAKNPRLNRSKIDKRLILSIPVDIRVVINWNMNNTDIDLHILDPNDEECYYRNRETSAGGRISADNSSGYGPEQFMLKKAIKGQYWVSVNYFGDRQFTSSGPSTVMVEIFTKYADRAEQRQVVSLQLSKAAKRGDGRVGVASFEF